ncbi:MAG: MlaD family protein, partial [Planctomycetes bacterium]|nr:MlaD family protein [Planctomycetota bacterium]
MDRATKTSSINVGFVMFVATVVVIIALFWVGSGAGIFQEQVQYHFMCPSTSRLKDGSRVYLSGVPVGKVEEIDFVDDLSINSVKVTVLVAEKVSRRIREDSSVSLQSDGLLGDVS